MTPPEKDYPTTQEYYRLKFELEQIGKQKRLQRKRRLVGLLVATISAILFHFDLENTGLLTIYCGVAIAVELK